MDFRSKKYERGSNWSDPEVVELLQQWADESVQIELESCLRNQHVFNRIAEVLRQKGILRTGDQCREKIKKMKLEYRRIKDNQKTIRGGRTWKFYEVMDRVLTNRPSICYSSLGGSVVAHQVLQGASSSDGFHLHNLPTAAFGSQASGAFLFGHPPKEGDLLEIKCEDVDSDDGLLNSDPPPPELLYQIGSGDEPDADSKSLGLEQEDSAEMGRGEQTANPGFSPSGCSDQNMAGSSGTGGSMAAVPATDEVGARGRCEGEVPRLRKRRRTGRGASGGGRGRLDEALLRFLGWQREAEQRFLALEEARLERETEAEERRERLELQRLEQDRRHELRLLAVFTSTLSVARGGLSSGEAAADRIAPSQPLATELSSSGPVRPQHSVYLSRRGNGLRQKKGILQEGYNMYHADKHDDNLNPNGIINMGTSENKLCYDLLSKRLMQADMFHLEPNLLQYPDWKGHRFLREEVAGFLTHYCKSASPLKAKNVVVMNGCGSLFSSIAAVLCDPGDAILIPTPFYGVITEDVGHYSGVRLVHAHLDCPTSGTDDAPFRLTVEKLEKALNEARAEGVSVRAVILVNPHNPLGEIYSGQEMTALLEFAKRQELHAIVDEVYMLSVFEELAPFHSVLGLNRLPDPQRTHVLWGVSKDFAAAGLRFGTVYSQNQDFVDALDQLASFHGIPGNAQHQVAQLLHDKDWINQEFLPQNRARLRDAHRYVSGALRDLGIPYLHRSAGFFIWADFRKCLPEQTFQEELSLWRRFLRHKVVLSCGQAFLCNTPGWFRIVFSDREPHLELGMKRIRAALQELEGVSGRSVVESAGTGAGAVDTLGDRGATVQVAQARINQLDQREAPASPGPGAAPLDSEDLVLMDCQSSQPTVKLDTLIGTLRDQIRSSDWLEKNTPQLSAGEDPELLEVFRDLLDRARK